METIAPDETRIGDRLVAARARADLDLNQAEARTKIRVKYLRALENEQWDELPSAVYAKGWLRAYGEYLGLDGEELVDEYRRSIEPALAERDSRRAEGLLERRRQLAEPDRRPRIWLFAVAVAGIVAAVLLVLGLGGGEEPESEPPPPAGGKAAPAQAAPNAAAKGSFELSLKVFAPLELCLVGGKGNALIDGQVVPAGARDEFSGRRFELRFPSGFERDQFRLTLGGKPQALPRAEGAAAFALSGPGRVRELAPPGRSCP